MTASTLSSTQTLPVQSIAPPAPTNTFDVGIDQVRFWVGAAVTAAIAAVTGLVSLILAGSVLHIPVLIQDGSSLVSVRYASYALIAAAITFGAAALFDAMLHVAPRPAAYYGWLVAMLTLLAVVVPFANTASLHSQIALAATNLAVGAVIAALVPMAAVTARR
jgi:hypothetical protein